MKPWFENSLNNFNNLKANLPHALIINGNKDIGKLEFAQTLVKDLIGKNISDDNLDDIDEIISLRKSGYPNLVYVRPELNPKTKKLSDVITIDQIRKFNEFIAKTSENLKIGIIYYADELHNSAANALLKTLEEPRKNTLIILLTHNIKLLPITLVSRCQKIYLTADNSNSPNWINENINENVDKKQINKLLNENNFVPKLVVDKINSGDYKIENNLKTDLINMAINPNNINKMDIDRVDLLVNVLQNLVISILRFKISKKDSKNKYYQHIISKTKSKFLFNLLDDINYAKYLLTTTINQKILIDSLLIIWSHITHLDKYPEIFSSIKE